jgi:hypothetical protein
MRIVDADAVRGSSLSRKASVLPPPQPWNDGVVGKSWDWVQPVA